MPIDVVLGAACSLDIRNMRGGASGSGAELLLDGRDKQAKSTVDPSRTCLLYSLPAWRSSGLMSAESY